MDGSDNEVRVGCVRVRMCIRTGMKMDELRYSLFGIGPGVWHCRDKRGLQGVDKNLT